MTGKTEKKPGQAWQAFRAHPGAVIRQTALQLLLRLAGIGALLAGLRGAFAPGVPPVVWYALAGAIYVFAVLPLRFLGGETFRACCDAKENALGVFHAPGRPYALWLRAGLLRAGRGFLWGLPFVAGLGLFLYGMEYLPYNQLGRIVKGLSPPVLEPTALRGVMTISVLLLAFLLLFVYGWRRDQAMEYIDVRGLGLRDALRRTAALRKAARGCMARHTAGQLLLTLPGIAGAAAVLVPYVKSNLRSGGDILAVLSRLLRLMKQPLPWAQLGLLAVALLLLYVPFCAARKLRNAALTAALDEGEGHAAG